MNFFKKHLFLLGFVWLGGYGLQAQVKVNTFSYTPPDEDKINESQEEALQQVAVKVINDYYDCADFLDESQGGVTATSLRNFKNLFQSSSRVLNDLTIGVNSHFSDYSGSVLEYLPKGVKFEMKYASISEMDYDEAGYFIVEVDAEKIVYSGLDYNNREDYCKTGRKYQLKFIIIVEENLKDAKIQKIGGRNTRRCEDAKPFVGFGIRGAADIGTTTFKNSSFLESKEIGMSGLNVETSSIWNAGAGLSFQLPITKKELLFLNVGANYSMYGLSVNMDSSFAINNAVIEGAQIIGSEGNEDWIVKKNISIKNGVEKLTVHTVEFPVGIRMRKQLKEARQFYLIGDIALVTTLQLFANADLSIQEASYSYQMDTNGDGKFDDAYSVDLPINDGLHEYGIGTAKDITRNPEITSNLSFSLRIAPGIQYELNDNIFLEAALEYSMGLTSFFSDEDLLTAQAEGNGNIQPTEQSNFFAGNSASTVNVNEAPTMRLLDDLNNSFIASYIEQTKVSTLGLRIGIVYLLDK